MIKIVTDNYLPIINNNNNNNNIIITILLLILLLFTVNNNYLPLMKIFAFDKNING